MRRGALIATVTGVGAAVVVAGVLTFSGETDPPKPDNEPKAPVAEEAVPRDGPLDPALREQQAEAVAQYQQEVAAVQREIAEENQRARDKIADATPP
jgi:hypothetical protein